MLEERQSCSIEAFAQAVEETKEHELILSQTHQALAQSRISLVLASKISVVLFDTFLQDLGIYIESMKDYRALISQELLFISELLLDKDRHELERCFGRVAEYADRVRNQSSIMLEQAIKSEHEDSGFVSNLVIWPLSQLTLTVASAVGLVSSSGTQNFVEDISVVINSLTKLAELWRLIANSTNPL
jgi:hypothetical protein